MSSHPAREAIARGARPLLAPWLLVASTALVFSPGCADRHAPDWSAVPAAEDRGIGLQVTSSHFLDVVVYAGRDGSWHRLGTVTGVGSERFDVPEWLAAPPGRFRLRVHAIGAPDRADYVTETILVNPGDVIELAVAGVLPMSTWHVRSSS